MFVLINILILITLLLLMAVKEALEFVTQFLQLLNFLVTGIGFLISFKWIIWIVIYNIFLITKTRDVLLWSG